MTAAAQTISLQLENGAFKVDGWKAPVEMPTDGWASIFAVYSASGDVPPMLGTYAVEDGTLIFRPRYPLAPGVRYRAVFHPPGGAQVETVFDGPRLDMAPTARVT